MKVPGGCGPAFLCTWQRPCVMVLVALLWLAACAMSWAQGFGLGERPPTPEEQAYIEAVTTEVDHVAPNDLARERAAADARMGRAMAQLDGLPAAVDNSTQAYFPPIDSQGSQGSCTAWAACYYYATYTQAKDEGYDVSAGRAEDYDHILSPAFMYPLINGGGDNGASAEYAVARLNDIGACSWNLKPYSQSDFTSWPSEAAWIDAMQNRTLGTHSINGSNQTGLEAIKQHLANGNLTVTRFSVYGTWYNNYPADKTGINSGVYYCADGGFVGGHAVTLVGYDDNKEYTDHRDGLVHKGAFLVANSWGNWWGVTNTAGKKGFFWVAYSMFLDSSFGPFAYYNDDRAHYRPSLYAVTGINHTQRGYLYIGADIDLGSGDCPDCFLIGSGGTSLGVTDEKRFAIDLTDEVAVITTTPPSRAFVRLEVSRSAGPAATLTSAEFWEDFDGDGSYTAHSSADPTLTIAPGDSGKAYATLHDLTVSVEAPDPAVVASGVSASLSATCADSESHAAAWSWSDGGAGGSFSPSAGVQNPSYSLVNISGAARPVTLTATVTCDGPLPLITSASTGLTVQLTDHFLTVTAGASPSSVASGGAADLTASATDASGHGIASWSWSDGGAGGTFSLSASAQNPTYTSAPNLTDTDRAVTLTVTATCVGSPAATGTGSASLIVQPISHTVSVVTSAAPSTVGSAGVTNLNAAASDARQGHSIASWSWSDGGAGGSFSPSPSVQSPSYIVPTNASDSSRTFTLIVSATCDGSPGVTGVGTVMVTVQPIDHGLTVAAEASPSVVFSEGQTQLAAIAVDSRGHDATWSWDDGGAGGSFSPSSDVRGPVYTPPLNFSGTDRTVTLTVTATCGGPTPIQASATTSVTVRSRVFAAFSATPSIGPAPLQVTFADQSAGGATSWSWAFGDGGSSTEQNPTHEYMSVGHRTITLTATDASGSDIAEGSIVVLFPDTQLDNWAWREVIACVDAGIVEGYGDGLYWPNNPVTRDQMAVFIARALAGGDPTGPATVAFTDITNPWANAHIAYCVEHGVVQGYDATHYRPDEVVDRGQMAVFVARARGWVKLGDNLVLDQALFSDVPAGFWAGAAVKACVDNAVVFGYDSKTYRPDEAVTRDQMAVYVTRAFGLGR